MADLTTLQRVEDRWHPVDGQEETNALALIAAASRRLRHLIPGIDDRISAGTLDADFVADIVTEAVLRVLKNPDGIKRVSVDDYTEERDSSGTTGGLAFTDDELALLRESAEPAGAFTIRPAGSVPRPYPGWGRW